MSDEAIKQTLFYKSAESCLKHGTPATFSRADYHTAITKRASDLKRAGETDAQAFTRVITGGDEIATTLYKASKFAKGPEIEPVEETKPEPKVLGPAHAKMQALATDHWRKNPSKTKEGAYADVYGHPDNNDLRREVANEHLNSMLKSQGARV